MQKDGFWGILEISALIQTEIIELEPDAENTLNVGDTVRITLRENRTTGYVWRIELTGDDILEITGDSYVSDPNPHMADGVGGTRYFTFYALAPGEASVELASMRDDEIGRTAVYRVVIPVVGPEE